MSNNELPNPFNVTKATDFSNQQIAEYWVDFYSKDGNNFGHYLNTKDLTAKYIIGGKGCGKTHLLRYYSYQLQKLRRNNDLKEVVINDKYIGLYNELGAMNSAKMYGYSILPEQWDALFGYYLELFVGINLLDVLIEIFSSLNLNENYEEKFIGLIRQDIFNETDLSFENTLSSFRGYINDLKKSVDSEIRNAALTRKINSDRFSIKLSPGDLFFKVPNILTTLIPELSQLKFIFILDELEKLKEYQKVYVNTLVWDKKDNPSTFWIGARTFGYTTRETKTGQRLTNGSEFKEIRLDEIMCEDEARYKKFAINLCLKRLNQIDVCTEYSDDPEVGRKFIDMYYEPFNELILLKRINSQNKKGDLYHQRRFKAKLRDGIKKKLLIGINASEIEDIFNQFIKNENSLYEKYKIFHFYKQWSRTKNGKEILTSLKREIEEYESGNGNSRISSYEEKYKLDFLAQLIFESNQKIFSYTGIDNFIKISTNNPRAFLVILKEIFERSDQNNESPFRNKAGIRVKTQSIGIYYASKWFYEESGAYGDDGKLLYRCINSLADLLQGIRFSDKPSETSPSTFSFKPEKVSAEADKFVQLAVLHRMLIPVEGRTDKNSDRIEKAYQINKMLAPYFNLPISRRGIVPLTPNMIEGIFNPQKHADFQQLFNDFIGKMNAPFGGNGELSKGLFQ